MTPDSCVRHRASTKGARRSPCFLHSTTPTRTRRSSLGRKKRSQKLAPGTALRRRKRLQQLQQDRADGDRAEKAAATGTVDAQQVLRRSKEALVNGRPATDSGAVTNPPPSSRLPNAYSGVPQPGDDRFRNDIVACMVSSLRRPKFDSELGNTVVSKARNLVNHVKITSLQKQELLSVDGAWEPINSNTYQGQLEGAPILALVTALRVTHPDANDPVFWPTLEENSDIQRRQR